DLRRTRLYLADVDPGILAKPREQAREILNAKRNAARRRHQPGARKMNEHRAPAIGDARPRIVLELDDQVVQVIVAPKPVPWRLGRKSYGPIVAAVSGVFTPGVIPADRAQRQGRARLRHAIAAPPHAAEAEAPARRGTVAFPFVCLDACATERHRKS